MLQFLGMLVRLIFGGPDQGKEYKFRCHNCFEIGSLRANPPASEDERVFVVKCGKCGEPTRMTVPIEPPKRPDESGERPA
jgi:hypothetical protein